MHAFSFLFQLNRGIRVHVCPTSTSKRLLKTKEEPLNEDKHNLSSSVKSYVLQYVLFFSVSDWLIISERARVTAGIGTAG